MWSGGRPAAAVVLLFALGAVQGCEDEDGTSDGMIDDAGWVFDEVEINSVCQDCSEHLKQLRSGNREDESRVYDFLNVMHCTKVACRQVESEIEGDDATDMPKGFDHMAELNAVACIVNKIASGGGPTGLDDHPLKAGPGTSSDINLLEAARSCQESEGSTSTAINFDMCLKGDYRTATVAGAAEDSLDGSGLTLDASNINNHQFFQQAFLSEHEALMMFETEDHPEGKQQLFRDLRQVFTAVRFSMKAMTRDMLLDVAEHVKEHMEKKAASKAASNEELSPSDKLAEAMAADGKAAVDPASVVELQVTSQKAERVATALAASVLSDIFGVGEPDGPLQGLHAMHVSAGGEASRSEAEPQQVVPRRSGDVQS